MPLADADAIEPDDPLEALRAKYKAAAEEIAAHIEETGDQQKQVAAVLQYSAEKVGKILKWRKVDYPEGTTPFTMADAGGSKPTGRSARSVTVRRCSVSSRRLSPRRSLRQWRTQRSPKRLWRLQSTKARARIKDAEREQIREDVEKMDIFAPTEEQQVALNFGTR